MVGLSSRPGPDTGNGGWVGRSRKIFSVKSCKDAHAGDIVVACLDLTYSQDCNRPLAMELLASMGTSRVWDSSKYILFLDRHPSANAVSAAADTQQLMFAEQQGVQL